MRCYYVLIHGKLNWALADADSELGRPDGFYCHRFVLARTGAHAAEKAFRRVRENLDRQTGWFHRGLAELTPEAGDLRLAPMHKLLMAENLGHTFYKGE
jgi:hypothetical protein